MIKKVFILNILIAFSQLSYSQFTKNGVAVDTRFCVYIEPIEFKESCLGDGKDKNMLSATCYITNQCEQPINVTYKFSGSFSSDKNVQNLISKSPKTEYNLTPGKRTRIYFCYTIPYSGDIIIESIKPYGSYSNSNNKPQSNSSSSNNNSSSYQNKSYDQQQAAQNKYYDELAKKQAEEKTKKDYEQKQKQNEALKTYEKNQELQRKINENNAKIQKESQQNINNSMNNLAYSINFMQKQKAAEKAAQEKYRLKKEQEKLKYELAQNQIKEEYKSKIENAEYNENKGNYLNAISLLNQAGKILKNAESNRTLDYDLRKKYWGEINGKKKQCIAKQITSAYLSNDFTSNNFSENDKVYVAFYNIEEKQDVDSDTWKKHINISEPVLVSFFEDNSSNLNSLKASFIRLNQLSSAEITGPFSSYNNYKNKLLNLKEFINTHYGYSPNGYYINVIKFKPVAANDLKENLWED